MKSNKLIDYFVKTNRLKVGGYHIMEVNNMYIVMVKINLVVT
jgi:hypothetical protein